MKLKNARRKKARKLAKRGRGEFRPIDMAANPHPEWMTRAFSNNYYVVMVQDNAPTTKGPAIKAMVQAHDNLPIKNHWKEMQRIKNEIFGEETMAIEYYPPESKLLDDHNIYWLWVFPQGTIPEWIPNANLR